MKKTLFISLIAILTTTLVSAQSIKTERMLYSWNNMKKMVVNSVKKMPEAHFNYAPTKGLRTFDEQVKYLTRSNRIFISKLTKVDVKAANKNTEEQVNGKEAIIRDLEASFDLVIASIPKIKSIDQNIILFGQKTSKMEGLMFMTDYLNQQHGKLMVYMNMKGVEPVKSTSWLQ
jgi:hypothetical protein